MSFLSSINAVLEVLASAERPPAQPRCPLQIFIVFFWSNPPGRIDFETTTSGLPVLPGFRTFFIGDRCRSSAACGTEETAQVKWLVGDDGWGGWCLVSGGAAFYFKVSLMRFIYYLGGRALFLWTIFLACEHTFSMKECAAVQLYGPSLLKHLEEGPTAGGLMWKLSGARVRSVQKVLLGMLLMEAFQPLDRLVLLFYL